MDSSALESRKEIACTINFLNLAKHDYLSCEHFVTYLFYNFSQVLTSKGKSKSKYANVLKTVMVLVAVAVIQKNE